ncbi:SH3 domain-containing protein [bacterium]|nr:SH3 domain-containing protein [bacterium]
MRVFFMYVFLTCLSFMSMATGIIHAQEQKKLIGSPDVIPPATEAMQHADFWISRINSDPDRVILTPQQIKELNKKNLTRPLEGTDINGNPYSLKNLTDRGYQSLQFYRIDPLAIQSVSGDSLRKGLQSGIDYVTKRELWDRRQIPFSETMKQDIIDAMDVNSIPDRVNPHYGIIVSHGLERSVPSHLTAFGSQFNWLDMFQTGSLETGMPVAVLHQSKSGDWYYVRSEFSYGWIPAAQIAVGTEKQIRHLSEPDNFIVALAHKVPVYSDKECKTWLTDFYQGARLRLEKKNSTVYQVLVPYRRPDGTLDAVNGWVRQDAGVNVGFQSFTQRNILNTIFPLLYHPYGWHDSLNERDCCGIIRTVYKTFGIYMPRGTIHELLCADHVNVFPKDTTKEVKYRYLDSAESGITLCGFSGHIVMYLGKVDGIHYVIHSNGYSYHDPDGTEIRVARVSVTDTELEGGGNVEHFTEISTFRP